MYHHQYLLLFILLASLSPTFSRSSRHRHPPHHHPPHPHPSHPHPSHPHHHSPRRHPRHHHPPFNHTISSPTPTISKNITLLTHAASTFIPTTEAHCECSCCTRINLQTQCSSTIYKVPLSEGHYCDARAYNTHDSQTCGIALCKSHFSSFCPSPSFFRHSCVSDRGFISDWAPLAFVTIALIALLLVALQILRRAHHRVPTLKTLHDDTTVEPGKLITQPLLQQSSSLRQQNMYDPTLVTHHATWGPSSTIRTFAERSPARHGRRSSLASLPPIGPRGTKYSPVKSVMTSADGRGAKHERYGSLPNVTAI